MERKILSRRLMPILFVVGTMAVISFIPSHGNPFYPKNSQEPVLNVRSLGAAGDGQTDDTRYFQRAVDSVAALGGGTVLVPAGRYLIDGDVSVKLKSKVTLRMVDTTAELIAKPTKSGRFYVLMILNATDVSILGGKIIGDRKEHLDTLGEWGMGIAIYGSRNILISETKITDCWGDGIVIGAKSNAPYNAPNPSINVTIKKVTSDNNRRQAITVGKANGVLIDSCILTNTNGTKPMAGIDIEPDRDTAQNVKIQNCTLAYNKGNGIEIYVNRYSVVKNVSAKNNFIHHNAYGGYLIRAQNVEFIYNRIVGNKYQPFKVVDTVNCVLIPNSFQ
jgi:nitrous oxidase accessory protein NosD